MLIHVEQGGASMATRTPKDDCMANTTANLTAQVEAGSDIPGCVRNKSDLSVGKKQYKTCQQNGNSGTQSHCPRKSPLNCDGDVDDDDDLVSVLRQNLLIFQRMPQPCQFWLQGKKSFQVPKSIRSSPILPSQPAVPPPSIHIEALVK